jgi:uncharacterized protein YbaR (Trm112 family)
MDIYIYKTGEQFGPFDIDQVRQSLQKGEVALTDQAWRQGLIEWTSLASMLQLWTCPQCKGYMLRIVEHPQRSTGIIITVLGILLAPVCVGLILMIWGLMLTAETKAHWHCSGCGREFPG